MATIDPNIAAFVQSAFRYTKAVNFAIKADYSNAASIVIDTQLDQASADDLAGKYLAEFGPSKRIVVASITGTLDDFSIPQRFTVTNPREGLNAVPAKLVACEIDYLQNVTTVTLRVG